LRLGRIVISRGNTVRIELVAVNLASTGSFLGGAVVLQVRGVVYCPGGYFDGSADVGFETSLQIQMIEDYFVDPSLDQIVLSVVGLVGESDRIDVASVPLAFFPNFSTYFIWVESQPQSSCVSDYVFNGGVRMVLLSDQVP
jgi:hypothetical protein